MDKEAFEIQAMDYLAGVMTTEERTAFEGLLEANDSYGKEFTELQKSWEKMENMKTPEPSEEMDSTFYAMLYKAMDVATKKEARPGFWNSIASLLRPRLAYGLLLIGIGLVGGYWLNSDRESATVVVTDNNNETEEVRQKLVLTLLDQPSANQRLQGVSEANKIGEADEIVINALLQTLNNDSNVNVRLAAIESLTHYVDHPTVRQGLVQAIPHQESPILQITLANLMVALQEKASIEPFKQLLREKQLDTTVQKKIRTSIESII